MTREELKFRYYRGEAECPWDGSVREQFKKAHYWLFEKFAAEAGEYEIVKFYNAISSKKNDPYFWTPFLYDAKVPEGEKAVAAYCMFASDMSMPPRSLPDYFSAEPFVSGKLED